MADDDRNHSRETEDAKEHLKQGLGHLWRAARMAATGFKKEIDRTNIARSIDDAGRELTRAATNVVGRIEKEIKKVQPGEPSYAKRPDPQDPQPWKQGGNNPRDEERQAAGAKPTGPTADDPGFRIATSNPPSDDKPQ
jgi:hypothetical protein